MFKLIQTPKIKKEKDVHTWCLWIYRCLVKNQCISPHPDVTFLEHSFPLCAQASIAWYGPLVETGESLIILKDSTINHFSQWFRDLT